MKASDPALIWLSKKPPQLQALAILLFSPALAVVIFLLVMFVAFLFAVFSKVGGVLGGIFALVVVAYLMLLVLIQAQKSK